MTNYIIKQITFNNLLKKKCIDKKHIFRYKITKQIGWDVYSTEKKVASVKIGGDQSWENATVASTTCGKCGHNEAYFQQIQTRSADEASTEFYKCKACGHSWNENN